MPLKAGKGLSTQSQTKDLQRHYFLCNSTLPSWALTLITLTYVSAIWLKMRKYVVLGIITAVTKESEGNCRASMQTIENKVTNYYYC